jgi:hypothetical protein
MKIFFTTFLASHINAFYNGPATTAVPYFGTTQVDWENWGVTSGDVIDSGPFISKIHKKINIIGRFSTNLKNTHSKPS